MNKTLSTSMTLALLALSTTAFSASSDLIKGRILIETKDGVSTVELEKIVKEINGKRKQFSKANAHIIDLPSDANESDIVRKLSQNPNIKFAQQDQRVLSTFVPNDTSFANQWSLPKINALKAWDKSQGLGVTIAILDSGVDSNHPDLMPNLVPGYNNYSNNSDTSDVCGHGTAVAGSAAAVSNNGLGIAGVAGKAKIMPIRIAYVDPADGRCWGTHSAIAAGLYYAADHGARIANVSYGGLLNSPAVLSAAQYFKNKGGLVFISAGNNGINENSAPSTSVISVSATDGNDQKTSWSSFGASVSLAAPGADILTTVRGGGYQNKSGTSFASPIAAGVAALMMALRPEISSVQIESLIFASALDIGNPGRDQFFGHGRVDAERAVQMTKDVVAVLDVEAPSIVITSPTHKSTVSKIVAVNTDARDNIGVTQVQFLVNGVVIGVDNVAPFSLHWNSSNVANGQATIVAIASDAAGNIKRSASVIVTVANVIADTVAPKVVIVNPVAGVVRGVVNINASATDNFGVDGIKQTLLIDGVAVTSVKGGTLDFSWDTRKVANGNHVIEVRAVDAAGNSASSKVVVTIKTKSIIGFN